MRYRIFMAFCVGANTVTNLDKINPPHVGLTPDTVGWHWFWIVSGGLWLAAALIWPREFFLRGEKP